MFKILIIEDDIKLKNLIKEELLAAGYNPVLIDDFNDIEEKIHSAEAQLILLDINLPKNDGFYLCRHIRRKTNIPIIIISARSGETEQIMGIELGADDYVTKPFSCELLLVKIKASLRRFYGDTLKKNDITSIGLLKLDENSFTMTYKNKSTELTKNEYKILKLLIYNKDRITSRSSLFEELWDDSNFVEENTLSVNMNRVKSKLQSIGVLDCIKTKRNAGYIFLSESVEGNKNG